MKNPPVGGGGGGDVEAAPFAAAVAQDQQDHVLVDLFMVGFKMNMRGLVVKEDGLHDGDEVDQEAAQVGELARADGDGGVEADPDRVVPVFNPAAAIAQDADIDSVRRT